MVKYRKRKYGVITCKEYPVELEREIEEDDFIDIFRKVLLKIYKHGENEKGIVTCNQADKRQYSQHKKNKLSTFLIYFATEHEILLQIILILPLTVMAFYILLVEKGSLLEVIKT